MRMDNSLLGTRVLKALLHTHTHTHTHITLFEHHDNWEISVITHLILIQSLFPNTWILNFFIVISVKLEVIQIFRV